MTEPLRPAPWAILRRLPRVPIPWVLLLIAYLSAWFFPVSWWFRWSAPGTPVPVGIDGPASWVERWWTNPESPTVHHWLVGPAALWVAHRCRSAAATAWRQTLAAPSALLRRWERFRWLPLGVVGVVVGFGHLTHVATVATLGLALAPWALVRGAYGPLVAKALFPAWACMAFLAMPPETVPTRMNEVAGTLVARGAAALGKLLGVDVAAKGWTLVHGPRAVSLQTSGGAAATASLAIFATVAGGLARRASVGSIAVRSSLALVFAFAIATARALIVALAPETVARVVVAAPTILAAPIAWLLPLPTIRLARRMVPRLPRPVRQAGDAAGRAARILAARLARGLRRFQAPLRRPVIAIGKGFDRAARLGGVGFARLFAPLGWLVSSLERAFGAADRRRAKRRGFRP